MKRSAPACAGRHALEVSLRYWPRAAGLLVLAATPVAASAATTSAAAPATLSPSGTYHFSVPANSDVPYNVGPGQEVPRAITPA